MIVVGIDPGNKSSGVSVWEDGELEYSHTVDPWNFGWETSMPRFDGDVRVYVEVPQNGTHKSRGGVHFAAGLILSSLGSRIRILRRHVTKVIPATWRKGVGRDITLTKEEAVTYALRFRGEITSHDEAEAILIGMYGTIQEGYSPSSMKQCDYDGGWGGQ